MKAETLSICCEPGEYYKTQGHKNSEKVHYKGGRYVNPTGFGWATEGSPSRITVGLNVKGTYANIWVDQFFKDNWGRLTAGRVEAVKATLPDELYIIKNESCSGDIYYTSDEDSMRTWLKDAMAAR